jgi:DnaA family protein
MKQLALDIGLATGPTLSNFFPGVNQAAVRHLELCTGDSSAQVDATAMPAYLWGESGAGKTHLLHGVREALREQGCRVGWLDSTTVYPTTFDDRWAAVLMDDVDLYNPVQQAVAFNWIINAMSPATGSPRWVLAAGEIPPSDLTTLRDDLRTRLGWGHVFQLHVLDEQARRSVLRKEADTRGVFLGDDVMDYMLKRFSRDLGSLMQLLDQLDSYALRTQRAVTIPLLKAMLESE